MNDKKVFTIIGIICIIIAIGVIVYTLIQEKPFNIFVFLPMVFAISCLIVARSSK